MDMQVCLRRWRRAGLLLVALTLCGWVLSVRAQQAPAISAGDPPDRVARVSYVVGDVGLLPHGATEWQDVDVNRPLTTGDRLSTGAGARLELEFGDAALRLAGHTAFGFLELGDWQTRMSLTNGTLQLSVRTLPDGEDYEIDTPQVAVVVDRPADVRVDLGDGKATAVSVRRGTAVVYGQDGARQVVAAGQRYRFDDATLDDVVALASENNDAFYRWCRSRDQLYADSESGRYVSVGTVGYQDLDYYGQWQAEVGYGQVWFPDGVDSGWVPYREGHWAWIAPWGWTWISDAPWGFAPFHYGRWNVFDGRWGWVPGPAVYAPALVAFVGGAGWQVSVGFGVAPVGWYPLGPGMIYNPWYRASRHYYRRVNRGWHHRHHRHWKRRVDTAYNAWRKPKRLRRAHYLGRHPPYGITVVSREVLAEGRDVHKVHLLHVNERSMRHAPVRFHGVHVRPALARHAVLHASAVRHLPVKDFARPVVARRQPSLAKVGRDRPAHTPWASPVHLLRRGSKAMHRPPHRPRRLKRLAVPSPTRARRTPAHVATRPHRARWHAAASPVQARHWRGRSAARTGGSLPVVPHLHAGPVRHTRSVSARRDPLRHDRHTASLPVLSRRFSSLPKPLPARPVRRMRVDPSGTRAASRPHEARRYTPPPVRAVGRPGHPAHRFVMRHHRPVPRPVTHARRSHAASHHASSGHRHRAGKPVHFRKHSH